MALRRKLPFQPDILEWLPTQRNSLKILRAEQYKQEKGFAYYFQSFSNWLRNRSKKAEEKEVVKTEEQLAREKAASRSMEQYYEAEELTKRMKWKRVTWDEDADYTSFSKRILDNDNMFKNTSAFSFMSMHVVKDPVTSELANIPPAEKVVVQGTLTNWVLQEREPAVVALYPTTSTSERRSAFNVDWSSGEVKILDTASAQEILTFVTAVAPRLQAVQVRMEEQQTKQVEDVENVRVRVGALVKFNEFNTSYWDDPKRKTDPNYINPDEMEKFLKGMLRSAFMYRWFLKGQQIRVVPPGRPYLADLEKSEVQIPANFAEYNWLRAHQRFAGVEKIFDAFRRYWWFWFSVGIVVVGDIDLL